MTTALVVGDFTGDGIPDVAAPTEGSVPAPGLVFVGRGDGRFLGPRMTELGIESPWGIAAADFDRDGHLDIAVTDRFSETVAVLRGLGNGYFQPAVHVPVGALDPLSLLARDLNLDGNADLVVVDFNNGSRGGRVFFLAGKGDGSFEDAWSLPAGTGPASPLAADVDGDGLPDVVLAEGTTRDPYRGSIQVFLNATRRGGSDDADDNGIPDSCEQSGCQVPGDCNQDERLDISDALCLLGYLFLGAPERLPCGEGLPAEEGNLLLLDWQPDGRVDLSDAISVLGFLFLGAPRHALAVPGEESSSCVPMAGCPPIISNP
jgi:hypothetical protein